MKEFLERHGLALAVGGGVIATLYASRKYLVLLLVLVVATCTYRGPVNDYLVTSRDQAHQERMAQIKAQTEQEQLRIEGEIALEQTRARAQAEAQAQQLRAQEQARQDALKAAKAKPAPTAPPPGANWRPTGADNLALAVQNARAELFRLTGVRDSLYTQYRTAQYYGNAEDAKKWGEQVALYDSYIAEQTQIIRKLTSCGSASVVACPL